MLGGDHRQYGSPDRATAWRGANGDLRSSGDRLDLAAEAITRLDGNREMARVTGLEPATSGVTGRRSNQLSYRSEEHTSELQSLMRISYAVFCLKKTKNAKNIRKLSKSDKQT